MKILLLSKFPPFLNGRYTVQYLFSPKYCFILQLQEKLSYWRVQVARQVIGRQDPTHQKGLGCKRKAPAVQGVPRPGLSYTLYFITPRHNISLPLPSLSLFTESFEYKVTRFIDVFICNDCFATIRSPSYFFYVLNAFNNGTMRNCLRFLIFLYVFITRHYPFATGCEFVRLLFLIQLP